jgi:hypothetical protein
MENSAQADDCLSEWRTDCEKWQTECEKAVRILSNLLHLAGRRQPAAAVLDLLRSVPRTPEEIDSVSTDSLLCQCVAEASDRVRPCDRTMLGEVHDYLRHLAKMQPDGRALLEASIAGVFLGWGMGGG